MGKLGGIGRRVHNRQKNDRPVRGKGGGLKERRS